MAAVEHVEETCGQIESDVLAQSETIGGDTKKARNRFLACVFIAGSNESKFEGCRRKLADDHASDQASRYPATVEDAVAVMQACLDDHDGNRKGTNFYQADVSELECFHCEELGHVIKDCPKKKADDNHEPGGKKIPADSHLTVWGGLERAD